MPTGGGRPAALETGLLKAFVASVPVTGPGPIIAITAAGASSSVAAAADATAMACLCTSELLITDAVAGASGEPVGALGPMGTGLTVAVMAGGGKAKVNRCVPLVSAVNLQILYWLGAHKHRTQVQVGVSGCWDWDPM